MIKTKVTKKIYEKVHKLDEDLGGKLTQRDIATLVGKHQTTVGRILRSNSYEEYKSDVRELHPPKTSVEHAEEDEHSTKEETAVIDLGADVVRQLTRIADSLEKVANTLEEVTQ